MLTHDPKLDDAALDIALPSDAAYVGAMGISPGAGRAPRAAAGRGHGRGAGWTGSPRPSGWTSGAVGPEETALSIMAEVVAVRNGRDGGRLRDKREGRIHDIGDRAQPAEPAASPKAGA